MHRLLNAGRSHPAANMNKPLPEPLVDPDEGKTPIGELIIVPIQGKDLPNRERFGKQDPFILFKLGNVSKRCSTDIRGGQRPRWKDDQINIFMYESDAKDATSLYVTCLDEDPQKNDLIGDCVINLARVLEKGEQDDWFELSYKGREAGQLMLQLTYYSHDPNHPTNKMNRAPPSAPVPGAPARRPIHPTKETKKGDESPTEGENQDEGPVYQAPVVPEPPAPAVPIVPVTGYPYGTMPAGGLAARPVSPSSHGHYVGHHTPQVPPANPYGIPGGAPPVNPYAPNPAAYPGYPAAGVVPSAYPDPSFAGADPSKRLSFTGQPGQPGGFLPAGYPPVAAGAPGYPPQVPGGQPAVPAVYPPHSPGFPPHSPAFPPHSPGFPPQNNSYAAGASPYPQAPALPVAQGLPNGPSPAYPYAASNVYPPNNNNNGGGGSHPYGNSGVMNSHSNGHVNNMNNGGNFNNNNTNNNINSGFNNNNNFNNGKSFNGGNNFNNNNGNNSGNNMNNFNNNNNNFNNLHGGNSFVNHGGNNGNNFNSNNNNNGNSFNSNNNNNGNSFNNNNNNGSSFNNNNNGNSFNNNNNNNSNFNSGSSFNSNSNSNSSSGSNYSNNNNSNNGGGMYPSAAPKKTNTISPSPIVRSAESMYRPDEF